MQLRLVDNSFDFLPPRPVRLPDTLSVAVARGVRTDVQRAAMMSGTTTASFLRDAIAERVRAVLEQQEAPNV